MHPLNYLTDFGIFPLPNTSPNIANHHSTWYLVATTSSSLVQFCCPHPKCQPYACAMEPKLRHSCINPLRHFLPDLFCSPSPAHFLFLVCVLPSSAVGFPRCQNPSSCNSLFPRPFVSPVCIVIQPNSKLNAHFHCASLSSIFSFVYLFIPFPISAFTMFSGISNFFRICFLLNLSYIVFVDVIPLVTTTLLLPACFSTIAAPFYFLFFFFSSYLTFLSHPPCIRPFFLYTHSFEAYLTNSKYIINTMSLILIVTHT